MIPLNKKTLPYALIVVVFAILIRMFNIKLPTSEYAQKKQDGFLQMVHILLATDTNLEIAINGRNINGLIFVTYTNGQTFDASIITPIPDYVERMKSFGYRQLPNKPNVFCKLDESVEFETMSQKKVWLLAWSYPNDDCKK